MKRIAVIVRVGRTDRVAEALRAAVGLGLRGDRVDVVLTAAALPALADPRVARAMATLSELGQGVVRADPAGGAVVTPMTRIIRQADAIEVWT